MKNQLVESKIEIPRVSKSFIPRQRLIDSLLEEKKLFLLHATVGYGKTVLLTHYAERTKAAVGWYHLDETDNDIFTFISYLNQTARKALSTPLFNPDDYIGLCQEEALLKEIACDLSASLRKMPGKELVLILDDFQMIHNEAIHQLIDLMLAGGGDRLTFMIATKGAVPPFCLKYFLDDSGAILSQGDLAFSEEEVRSVFENMGITGVDETFVSDVASRMEGWPAGVMFSALSARQNRGRSGRPAEIYERATVESYFMHELFRKLSYEIQMFLINTSVLDFLDAGVCNAVMKISNAQSILDYLTRENLFTIKLGGGENLFRYHSLFKEFLESQIKDETAGDVLDTAASYYLRSRNKEQAVEYALRGGNAALMQRGLEAAGAAIMDQGKLETLGRWLDWLFEKGCILTPKNMLICGMYYFRTGNSGKAMEYIDRAIELFLSSMDENNYYYCLMEKARILRHTASPEESCRQVEPVLPRFKSRKTDIQIALICQRVRNYIFLSRFKEALSMCSQYLLEARQEGSRRNESIFLRLSGIVYFYIGNYKKSRRLLGEAGRLRAPGAGDWDWESSDCYMYDAFLQFFYNDEEGENALACQEFFHNNCVNRLEVTWLAYVFQAYMKFLRLLGVGKGGAGDGGERLRLLEGEAARTVSLAEKYGASWKDGHIFAGSVWAIQYLLNLEAGDLPGQAELSAYQQELSRATPFIRELCPAVLTGYLLMAEREEEAAAMAQECVSNAFLESPCTVFSRKLLLQKALGEGDRKTALHHATKIQKYIEESDFKINLLSNEEWETVLSLTLGRDDGGDTNLIRVQCLGGFDIYLPRKQEKVKWRTKKTQELFAYLFHLQGRPVEKNALLLALWPDTEPKKATSLLHTTLYNIRKILDEDGIADLIVYENRQYFMNMDLVTSDRVRFRKLCRAYANGEEETLLRNRFGIDLYQGPYMDGIDGDFCAGERAYYENHFIHICQEVAGQLMALGNYQQANEYLLKAISADEYAEELYLMSVKCSCALGDVKNAKRQYEKLKKILREELDTEPQKETEQSYQNCIAQVMHKRKAQVS